MRNNPVQKLAEHGIVFVLAPSYSNLGDVAIFVQSLRFIKDNSPLPLKAIFYTAQGVKRKMIQSLPLYNDDLIVIQGGGNMGSLYPFEEIPRQKIIKWFPQNQIISLPQSVYFGNLSPNYLLNQSIRIYSNHKKLTIFARDIPSFDFCKSNYKCNVELCPDMVLSATPMRISEYQKNKKVLLCLRKDIESNISIERKNFIEKLLIQNGFSFEYWDTDDSSNQNIKNKEQRIYDILSYFNQFQFIVTDRYHGTVLCYISKSPCIAINNSYGKVKNGFYWFQNTNYMFFADQDTDLPKFITKIENIKDFKINPTISQSFLPLKKLLAEKQ
jgi:pyruvyl transferase EpsI